MAITAVIFAVTLSIFNFYVKQEKQEGSLGASNGARVAIWQHSFAIFLEQPIFGVGPYNYYDYSLYVASKRNNGDQQKGVMTSPHGQYVQLLVETGIIGVAAFLWFIIELFKLIKYFLTDKKDFRINIIASALSAILISRLAAGILGDYIIPQYHNGGLQSFCSTIYFWVAVGILVGLKRVHLLEQKKNGIHTPN